MLATNRAIRFSYICCSCRKLSSTVLKYTDTFQCGKKDLKQKKKNDRQLYLFGPSSCYSAILSGRRELKELYLNEAFLDDPPMTDGLVPKLITEAKRMSLPVSYRPKDFLDRYVRGDNRCNNDVVLKCGILDSAELGSGDLALKKNDEVWLALDQVVDPMNLGAIIRTCSYYGVSKVVVSKGSCSLSPVVSFESDGVVEWFPIYNVPSMEKFLEQSSAAGWDTIASVGPESERFDKPLHLVDGFCLQKPSILVVGSEHGGLTDKVVRSCSHAVTVNSFRHNLPWGLDSLNVSIATGVMLHLLLGNCRSQVVSTS